MPKGNKSDKVAQKKNNYQVIKDGSNGESPGKIPSCACDRKRCLNGRCGSCWLVILGFSIAVGIFIILYLSGVLGFDFSTDGTDTLYEVLTSDTEEPTASPTTSEPTLSPTANPTLDPTADPTATPTTDPTNLPTTDPTLNPTGNPTVDPTSAPTADPTTSEPTTSPTYDPTSSPTYQPTADPTSERRRSYDADLTANILFVIADGTVFDYNNFETPVVDEFLTEGYTFNNVKQRSLLASFIAGKTAIFQSGVASSQGVSTWTEQLRSKGYTNYYYGSWMDNSESKMSTPLRHGWDFFYGTVRHSHGVDFNYEDVIMEKVQSRLQMINDEKWTITVNWTISKANDGVEVNGFKTPFETCTRYFKVGGAEFNYYQGLSCQMTMGYDATFGKVLETLKSTRLWMKTIVVFVITGQQKNIFSMSGGALPANFLNRTNGYPYSMLDVVPTTLAVSGFSDVKLAGVKPEEIPAFGMNLQDF